MLFITNSFSKSRLKQLKFHPQTRPDRIILKIILKPRIIEYGLNSIDLRYGQGKRLSGQRNEPYASIQWWLLMVEQVSDSRKGANLHGMRKSVNDV